jgi:drug/metabolite transporter (DMT)-like permease
MINAQVFWILMLVSLISSVAKTFDARASKMGTLSNYAIVLMGYATITLTMFIVIFLLTGTKTIKEIKNHRGPEWKYLLTSGVFLVPFSLAYYWFYKKEQAHIISLLSTGFAIVFGLISAALFAKEKVKPQTWIGAAIMFVGLALINYYHEQK